MPPRIAATGGRPQPPSVVQTGFLRRVRDLVQLRPVLLPLPDLLHLPRPITLQEPGLLDRRVHTLVGLGHVLRPRRRFRIFLRRVRDGAQRNAVGVLLTDPRHLRGPLGLQVRLRLEGGRDPQIHRGGPAVVGHQAFLDWLSLAGFRVLAATILEHQGPVEDLLLQLPEVGPLLLLLLRQLLLARSLPLLHFLNAGIHLGDLEQGLAGLHPVLQVR
mmetsp:Transcript_108080/g.232905  ORF Transcript_108080/g.232905 Transcript_108080/m.232905 type:complete len:216 (-) Transcript_108080:514-1161(-)